MTGPTHKQFAITFALIFGAFLKITSLNYYLALILLTCFSKAGALFPDLDHNWENIKDKNVVTWLINHFIHLLGGKHRSWVTHSWDLAIISNTGIMLGLQWCYNVSLVGLIDYEVLMLIIVGFYLGWYSHLFSDMLTPAGVRMLCWSKKKYKFVPKKFFGIKFSTGTEWENIVQKIQSGLNIVLTIFCITRPLLLYFAII